MITLRADDGTFVKRALMRFFPLEGHYALLCDQKKSDELSKFNFTVEIVGPNKIRLIADNGNYCKRFCPKPLDMNFISMDKNVPDPFSDFLVNAKGGNKITLKAENGQFLKRFFNLGFEHYVARAIFAESVKAQILEGKKMNLAFPGEYQGKSFITAYQFEEDPHSIFRVTRGGTKCIEVVEDIQFDLTQLQKNAVPLAVGSQTLVNNSSEEQTMELKVSKTVETTKSFEWDYSFNIGVETKFTAGIPLLAENETTVKVDTGFTLGGSKSDKDSETIEASFPIKCPPFTTQKASAMIQLGRVDVPYTAKIGRSLIDGVGNTTKYTYYVKGKFHGTNAFDLNYIIDEIAEIK